MKTQTAKWSINKEKVDKHYFVRAEMDFMDMGKNMTFLITEAFALKTDPVKTCSKIIITEGDKATPGLILGLTGYILCLPGANSSRGQRRSERKVSRRKDDM